MAWAEKRFNSLLGEVAMSGGDIDQQWIGSLRSGWQRNAETGIDLFTNKVFYHCSWGGL